MVGKKRLVSYILLFSLIVSLIAIPDFLWQAQASSTVAQNKTKQAELNKKNQELKRSLEKSRKDVQNQEQYKKTLDQQIAVVKEQVDISNNQIFELDKLIEEKEKQIAETNDEIDKNIEILKKRLKAIYVSGETSTLDIILGAKDFSDFIDKAEIIKKVSDRDAKLISKLNSDINSIKEEQESISADRENVVAEKKNLDGKKAELQSLLDESQRVLATLEGTQEKLIDRIDENDAEIKKVNAEIEHYYAELAAKQAQERAKQLQNNKGSSTGSITEIITPSAKGYAWPVPGYNYISSNFYDTYQRGGKIHGAIDIAGSGIYGSKIVSADGGKIIFSNASGYGGGYGIYAVIDHGNGRSTLYAHMSGLLASTGQTVVKGQVIGYVGSTGHSTGPHLHFETRLNGVRYNPMAEY